MGLITNLIGNVAQARNQEQAQQAKYNAGLAETLGAIIKNPSMDAPTQFRATQYLTDLATKHGGKEGKAMAGQINQFLSGAILHQKMAQMFQKQREDKPQSDPNAPGGVGATPATSLQTLAAMSPQAPQAPAPPQGRLQRLAGIAGKVGGALEELGGVPRNVTRNLPQQFDPALFGQTPEQEAEQTGRLKAQTAAAEARAVGEQMRKMGVPEAEIKQYMEEALMKGVGVTPRAETKTMLDVRDEQGNLVPGWFSGNQSGRLFYNSQEVDALPAGLKLGGKLGTAKTAPAETLAGPLKLALQVQRQVIGDAHPDWPPAQVEKEARKIAAQQVLRSEAGKAMTVEQRLQIAGMQAELAGMKPPAPWTSEGQSFNVEALGIPPKIPQIPPKGQPITDPVLAASMDEYYSRAMGLEKFPARDAYSNMRYSLGRQAWVSRLGSIEAVNAAFEGQKAAVKNLNSVIGREAAVDMVTSQLENFGVLLQDAKSRTTSTGMPLIDAYINRANLKLGGDDADAVAQLDTAVNAVARTYATLLSNANFQSIALPHVATQQQAAEAINSAMAGHTIDAVLQQMKSETVADKAAQAQQEAYWWDRAAGVPQQPPSQREGAKPKAGAGVPKTPPKGAAGEEILVFDPATGKTTRVKKQ